MTPRNETPAFDILDLIRKEFAKGGGRGTWPIVFESEDGQKFKFASVTANEQNGTLVVALDLLLVESRNAEE